MDEFENTGFTEQAEETGTPEDLDTIFESGWDDDGLPEAEEDVTTADESEGEEADADQQEADEPEGGDDSEPSSEEEQGTEDKPDQAESFTLRHLGEERTVSRDEVIKLAQQGMDYGRIREKWDSIKEDVPKLRMYEGFLKELAEARGGDIESLIDETRTRSLIARAEARGERLDPSAAAAQAVKARMQAMAPDEAQKQAEMDEAIKERRKESIDRFFETYGNEIKAEEIPQEVWAEAERTFDLTGAYQRYLNRNLEAENKRLKDELEQTKQQKKNRERSMGSSKSVGSSATKDTFDEGWDEAW